MTQWTRRLALVVAVMSAPFAWHLAAQSFTPDKSAHVVVISLDGFTSRALANPALPLPTLRRLARAGAAATVMTPVNPDGDLGQSHLDHQRRDAGEARRDLQRPAGARAWACRRRWSRGATRPRWSTRPRSTTSRILGSAGFYGVLRGSAGSAGFFSLGVALTVRGEDDLTRSKQRRRDRREGCENRPGDAGRRPAPEGHKIPKTSSA